MKQVKSFRLAPNSQSFKLSDMAGKYKPLSVRESTFYLVLDVFLVGFAIYNFADQQRFGTGFGLGVTLLILSFGIRSLVISCAQQKTSSNLKQRFKD